MTTKLGAVDAFWRTRANADAVETLLDYTGLPTVKVVPGPELVHVVVANVDDLYQWQDERGGEIRQGAPVAGVAAWTLDVATDPARDRTVAIRVSTLVVDGEPVEHNAFLAVA